MTTISMNGVNRQPWEEVLSVSDYILIQCPKPIDASQRTLLQNLGVEVREFVSKDTWLCRCPQGQLEAVRQLPFVSWANYYCPGLKFDPVLQQRAGPVTIDLSFHPNTDTEAIKQQIAAAAQVDPGDIRVWPGKARLTAAPDTIAALSRIDSVRQINEVGKTRFFSDVARCILWSGDPGLAPASDLPQGDGQFVVVADSGFDNGSTTDTHPAFTDRVHKIYNLRSTASGNDTLSHGTMVAFSVLGDYQLPDNGPRITGMAPKATLIVQALPDDGESSNDTPPHLADLFMPPYQNDGARIHSNSWGHPGRSVYDRFSQEVDEFIYDQRDFVLCFAAGNEALPGNGAGPLAATISSPGTAKNCITVGASENFRPNFSMPYSQKFGAVPAPIDNDPMANNIEGVAAFSSRGPAHGNRFKPDVVAPGTYILATRSRSEIFPSGIVWDTDSQDPLLLYGGGTSQATPLVAGAVAIIREFVVNTLKEPNPSAALIKALLINGARSISGQYDPSEAGPAPNNASGFGRVDVGAIVRPVQTPAILDYRDERTALDTNEEESLTMEIPAGINTVKVTLVWTDPPGAELQSDLDLILRHTNGQERHGNMAAGSAEFDRENNVEQVQWDHVSPGIMTVTVRAYRVTGNPQNYALVIRTIKDPA